MNFAAAKEMSPYLEEPKAMPVGTPGKMGYLFLGFELDDDGRSIMRDLERHAPLIVQQELYFDEGMPEMPCVYILSSGGPNVDGDRYEQRFVVREGAYAHISTGAATKLAEMRYNYSGLTQAFELEEDSYLEYLPEPMIPCRHTRFIADTAIRIAPSATLFYSEIYMSGRKYFDRGETFLYIVLRVLIMIARISSYRVVIALIFNAFEDGTHCVPKVCYFCSFDALGILQPFKNPCFNTLRNVEFRDSASFKKASKDNTYKPNGMRIFLSSSKITVCSL